MNIRGWDYFILAPWSVITPPHELNPSTSLTFNPHGCVITKF